LLQSFEAPVTLRIFQRWHTKELLDRFLRAVGFELFGIVILVFDVNVSTFRFVIVFVLEVIPGLQVSEVFKCQVGTYSASESCMKSSSSDMAE
jgi:hypothetical protein